VEQGRKENFISQVIGKVEDASDMREKTSEKEIRQRTFSYLISINEQESSPPYVQ